MNGMNLGRDRLAWSQEIWNSIDQAVHDECQRTKVAAKFLPLYPVGPDMLTVPSDAVDPQTFPLLTVNEAAVTPLLEMWVDFALTKQQYEDEEHLHTAVTLAINAANKLSRAEDLVIFQGDVGLSDTLFQSQTVNLRGAKRVENNVVRPFPITGLLPADSDKIIPVEPTEPYLDPAQNRYGENTFGAVAMGYSLLQRTHYGRQALVLPTSVYADTYAPLRTTLIMPADRLKGLVEDRCYGTGALPDQFLAATHAGSEFVPRGVLAALDGNTMDLVVGMDTITQFTQVDTWGLYLFRVFERFTLRLKDRTAVLQLEFRRGQSHPE
jgi:uncharacterized linocin/CFP29 family protein